MWQTRTLSGERLWRIAEYGTMKAVVIKLGDMNWVYRPYTLHLQDHSLDGVAWINVST